LLAGQKTLAPVRRQHALAAKFGEQRIDMLEAKP